MRPIQSDDELLHLHNAGVGLIYNDFSGRGASGAKNNVLHAAHCSWVVRSNVTVRKIYFDSIVEATDWLLANRGSEGANWKRCGTCHAHELGRVATTTDTSMPSSVTRLRQNDLQPFTEGQVEASLIPWLESNGYVVTRRVRVTNGIVDLVAIGVDRRWAIEAKGEDRGGFGTAEMNFQIGLGQIISRMTEPTMNYALAIPLTSNFRQILKKFRGVTAFEKLDLTLFIIDEGNTVHQIAPADVSRFLDALQ